MHTQQHTYTKSHTYTHTHTQTDALMLYAHNHIFIKTSKYTQTHPQTHRDIYTYSYSPTANNKNDKSFLRIHLIILHFLYILIALLFVTACYFQNLQMLQFTYCVWTLAHKNCMVKIWHIFCCLSPDVHCSGHEKNLIKNEFAQIRLIYTLKEEQISSG